MKGTAAADAGAARGTRVGPRGARLDQAGIRAALQAGDPVSAEPALTTEDARAIRRLVVAAVPEPRAAGFVWWRAAAVGALGTAAIVAGVLINDGDVALWRRIDAIRPQEPKAVTVSPASEPGEARQIQFSTPGGTRIIWLLDPAFKL